ncbi:alkaline shock response membrane anchor protein AmaP [Vallicoccus soli]|uniref:Alkaline shock response membrane anchor protein AmaP n=1 Tax=Vallicoccus soli TaxID=2339232 RepID=A0A3A3Z2W0_9ACTN|nr:alkaline shock response membrane anchor protein AmaP [Vallicoccus soli]RJK94791.1 alkaline shock response membrane anchor protein AmaP [Vallicoccus soli]
MRRVDRVGPVLVALLGLALLVGGALGAAAGLGALGAGRADDPVLAPALRAWPQERGWAWWAVAGGCLAVALLALWWLLAQLRTDRVARLDLSDGGVDGALVLRSGALADAVEEEVGRMPGVVAAGARVHGRRGHRLAVVVDVDEHADVPALRERLVRETAEHARAATGDPGLPVEVLLRPAATGRRALA